MFALTLTDRQKERLPELLLRLETARVQQRAGEVLLPAHDLTAVAQQLRNIISLSVRQQVLPPVAGKGALLLPLCGVSTLQRPSWGGFPVAGLAYDSSGKLYVATVGDKQADKPLGTVSLLAPLAGLGLSELDLLRALCVALQGEELLAPDSQQVPAYQQQAGDLDEVLEDAPTGRLEAILSRYE